MAHTSLASYYVVRDDRRCSVFRLSKTRRVVSFREGTHGHFKAEEGGSVGRERAQHTGREADEETTHPLRLVHLFKGGAQTSSIGELGGGREWGGVD